MKYVWSGAWKSCFLIILIYDCAEIWSKENLIYMLFPGPKMFNNKSWHPLYVVFCKTSLIPTTSPWNCIYIQILKPNTNNSNCSFKISTSSIIRPLWARGFRGKARIIKKRPVIFRKRHGFLVSQVKGKIKVVETVQTRKTISFQIEQRGNCARTIGDLVIVFFFWFCYSFYLLNN